MRNLLIITCAILILVAPIGAIALTNSEPSPKSNLAWYIRIRPWECSRRCAVYRLLGVSHFKRALLYWYDQVMYWAQRTIGHWIFRQKQLDRIAWRHAAGQHLSSKVDRKGALTSALLRTKQFELIHLFCLFPIAPIVATICLSRHFTAAAIIAAITSVTSVYPILLQRYNRARLQMILGSGHETKSYMNAGHSAQTTTQP